MDGVDVEVVYFMTSRFIFVLLQTIVKSPSAGHSTCNSNEPATESASGSHLFIDKFNLPPSEMPLPGDVKILDCFCFCFCLFFVFLTSFAMFFWGQLLKVIVCPFIIKTVFLSVSYKQK